MEGGDDLDDILFGNEAAKDAAADSSSKGAPKQTKSGDAKAEPEADQENDDVEDESSDDDLEIVLDGEAEETKRLLLKPNQQQKQDDEANKMDEVVPLRKTNININGIGTHNGQSILEVDLDDQEEKPWRRPGADITDYFNYGFNEQTWKLYCMKQKELREEMGMHKGKSLFDRIADDMGVPVGGQFEMKHEPRYEQQSQTGRRSAEGGSSRPEKRHYDDRSDYQHSDQHRDKRRREQSMDSRDSRGDRRRRRYEDDRDYRGDYDRGGYRRRR